MMYNLHAIIAHAHIAMHELLRADLFILVDKKCPFRDLTKKINMEEPLTPCAKI